MLVGSHIERIIREAQAGGAFDGLAGSGKPLPPESMSGSAIAGVLKGATALPEWLELLRRVEELEAEIAEFLRGYAGEYAGVRQRFQQAAADVERSPRLIRVLRRLHTGEGREAARRAQQTAAAQRRWDVAAARYAYLLGQLAPLIERYHFVAPEEARRLPRVDVAERVAWFVEEFPRPA